MYKARVSAVGHYVPPKVVSNDDLSKLMDTSNEWIIERTGIQERRFADPETDDLGHGQQSSKSGFGARRNRSK